MTPPSADGPAIVNAGFFLYDLNEVQSAAETFEFEGILSLNWKDERLAFDPDELGATERVYKGNYQFAELFDGWWPQVVLANESGYMDREGVLLRIQPDGSVYYVEEFDAVAETPMDLTKFPFDRQVFRAIFKVIGYDTSEVRLQADPGLTGLLAEGVDAVGNAAWRVESVAARASEDTSVIASPVGIAPASLLEVSITAARIPGYMLRSIVAPLVLLITLSWSVFWMSRESLGDRINLSFIGLLTVVAFQTIVDDDIAQIPYFTAMNGFLLINYVLLAGTIVVNLRVGYLDAAGRSRDGDAIDRRCRWLFPLVYLVVSPILLVTLALMS